MILQSTAAGLFLASPNRPHHLKEIGYDKFFPKLYIVPLKARIILMIIILNRMMMKQCNIYCNNHLFYNYTKITPFVFCHIKI